MSKPGARRFSSDDCTVTVSGEVFHPHEGEWVELLPGMSVGEVHAFRALQDMGPAAAAAAGEPDELAQIIPMADDAFERLLAGLCRRLVAWSWTDYMGEPLPQPQLGNPDPLRVLESEEVLWLVRVVMGRTPTADLKGSKPLPTTSSGSAPPRSRSASSSARNRTRGS